MPHKFIAITCRAQALALLEAHVTIERIRQAIGLSESPIYCVRRIAKQRGYNSVNNPVFKDEYFEDAKQSG